MPVDLKSLREERAQTINDARKLVDAAEAEKRSMTDEENATFDTMMSAADDLRSKIEREERLRESERTIEERAEREDERRGGSQARETAASAMDCFRGWLSNGRLDGGGAEEFRALQATVDTDGGYLVTPEAFVMDLIKAVDDMTHIRSMATTYQVPRAASMGAPELTADPADADWTSELGTGSEDSTMAFGKRSITPHPLAKRIKVSSKLLRSAVMPVEQLVRDRLAYKFSITEEKAFLTGNGVEKPLGVFTASNDGIGTARDVSTDNTTTAMTADGLINCKYSLKTQYWSRADWLFHRDAMKQIVKLKDGDGQYLLRESLRAGEPDVLLGRPVHISEYAPNTFTTGLYVGILGDFSNYWIVDALDMQMQRLVELYAETNQVGFIARRELDGAPVLAEAFARVKLA